MGKYEEALERARQGLPIDEIFPELKESEDERIRKWLIEMVEELRKANPTNAEHNGNCSEAIAYLERQKEQKPVFKKGDKVIWQDEEFNILDVSGDSYNVGGYTLPFYRQNELSLIKHQPAEWSEEDEAAFGDLMWCIEQARKSAKDENDMGNIWFAENWLNRRLKSLHPQPRWKPSEEQIDVLEHFIGPSPYGVIIAELHDDLQKLL